jgi:hypothetical protein
MRIARRAATFPGALGANVERIAVGTASASRAAPDGRDAVPAQALKMNVVATAANKRAFMAASLAAAF